MTMARSIFAGPRLKHVSEPVELLPNRELRLAQQLRESEEKFHAIFEQTALGIGRVNFTNGRWIEVNDALCRMLGYNCEKMLATGWLQISHPEDAHRELGPFRRMAAGELETYTVEKRFIHKEGHLVWAQLTASLVRDFEKRPNHELVIIEDITGRKQIEQGLRDSEARLRLAVETAELGTYERDLITNEMTLNPACRRILGVPDGPLPVEFIRRSVHPEDKERIFAAIARAFDPALREICAGEFRVIRPDGTMKWLAGRGRVVFDDSTRPARGQKFIGVLNDITNQKLAEEGLLRAQEDLSRAVADLERQVNERTAELQVAVIELEQLSYSMIHDLRAPLRAIQSFGGLVAEDSKSQLSAEAGDLVEKMRAAANRMDRLVVDTLNYTKVIRGELPVGPVDVGMLASGIAQTYPELQLPKSHVRVAPDLPLVVGNEAALTQCLAQMMQNAAKFCKPGQAARIEIRGEKIGSEWCRIVVEDNGIGIAAEFQQKIFGMFQRLSTAAEGTGVGLAIVKKAAERMGGRVGVESELGKGSRFWIELKAAMPSVHVSAAAVS
jgi:PAS domain S-box-containing protein